MHEPTFDPERQLPANEAISLALSWAEAHGIVVASKTLAVSETTNATATRTYLRSGSGDLLAQGSGKGFGIQARASGLFEAIEHAATHFRLPGQHDPRLQEALPFDERVEAVDRAYTVARKLMKGTKQDALVFHELSETLDLIQESFCIYPRIACDITCPVDREVPASVALAAYSATTGTAAGTSWRDSVLHGLNEVIERDAESQFLLDVNMGRRTYRTVELPHDDPLQDLFVELTKGRGRSGAIYMLEAVAGYVFCAVSEPTTPEGELGLGSSQDPRIALERALTELQQLQNATSLGSTWQDEGGEGLDSLRDRPNMLRLATQVFPIDTDYDMHFDELPKTRGPLPSPVQQLRSQGFTPFARQVWRTYFGKRQIVVTQTIVPGLESLSNLVFGRRILPTGRLLTRDNVDFLQEPAV